MLLVSNNIRLHVDQVAMTLSMTNPLSGNHARLKMPCSNLGPCQTSDKIAPLCRAIKWSDFVAYLTLALVYSGVSIQRNAINAT